ncbi:unnamed protein product [Linum trigynum]|uniref:Cytochrome P450 n=1 Tax=Linum trigynum TaxID=586398 RepID=A0AAV2DHG6_9ROSI
MGSGLLEYYLLLPFLLTIAGGTWLVISRKRKSSKKPTAPGPWQLPIIGNLHQLMMNVSEQLPAHQFMRQLAQRHGPVMRFQVGEVASVYLSSAEGAEQVMRTHDVACATRPFRIVGEIIHYGCKDLVFLPYGEEWRQLRKLCVIELLSARRVSSFRNIRKEEVANLVRTIRTRLETQKGHQDDGLQAAGMNLKPVLMSLTNVITSRSAFGMAAPKLNEKFVGIIEDMVCLFGAFEISDLFPSLKFLPVVSGFRCKVTALHRAVDSVLDQVIKQHVVARSTTRSATTAATKVHHGDDTTEDLVDILLNLQQNADLPFTLTTDAIKAVLLDMFIGGTDTSAVTIEWTMSEMMKNPSAMERAQAEVRSVFSDGGVSEEGLHKLVYLNAVINETFRLHPPGPILPRINREKLEIDGFEIRAKTQIMVNVWAIGRDPRHWSELEKFDPDRFLNSAIDYNGRHFMFLPFGAGRRMCPGIQFAMVTVQLALANLLFHFDWKLPHGMKPEDLDMTEIFRAALKKKENLCLIPRSRGKF